MASMSNIDAKESFWATRGPDGFTSFCDGEIYRMRKSPFSSQRLDVNRGEPWVPKKKAKTGREELENVA